MVPVAVQRPVFGLYSSDSAIAPLGSPTDGQPFVAGPGHLPPATRTRPLGSSVAVCHARGWIMSPVLLHVPARGSYSSADASALVVDSSVESSPPATRTRPSGRSVAVCSMRATLMFAVVRQLPSAAEGEDADAAGVGAADAGGADDWLAGDGVAVS